MADMQARLDTLLAEIEEVLRDRPADERELPGAAEPELPAMALPLQGVEIIAAATPEASKIETQAGGEAGGQELTASVADDLATHPLSVGDLAAPDAAIEPPTPAADLIARIDSDDACTASACETSHPSERPAAEIMAEPILVEAISQDLPDGSSELASQAPTASTSNVVILEERRKAATREIPFAVGTAARWVAAIALITGAVTAAATNAGFASRQAQPVSYKYGCTYPHEICSPMPGNPL